MLTSDQVDLFQAFGYLHLKQAFDAEETAFIQREFDTAIRRAFGTKFPRCQIAIAFLQLPWREDQVVHLKSRAAVQPEGCYQPRSLLTHLDPRVRAMVTGLQELGFPEGGLDS